MSIYSVIFSSKIGIQAFASIILCALALWRGGGPERAIAAVVASMWLGDSLAHGFATWTSCPKIIPDAHLIIDCAATAGFFIIALQANRVYPLWIAGFQLISTVAHLVRALYPVIGQSAFAILMIAPSYFVILAYGIGTWFHLRRQAKMGPYRSWDNS